MKFTFILLHFLLLLPSISNELAQASALVEIDPNRHVISLTSHFHFYGPEATPALTYSSAEEISRLWNEPHAEVNLRGVPYRVQFRISYSIGEASWYARLKHSCANNHVLIRNLTEPADRSSFALRGAYGIFYTSDDLGHTTTAAHEYGHGLGLNHDDIHQTSAALPGIMFARGTWVAPQFQYDPLAIAGALEGGTLNPVFRKVRAEDIAALHLEQLSYYGYRTCIGDGTLFDPVIPDESVYLPVH